MRRASMEVRKFNSLRAAPVVVLNKQRRRGDKDGCNCNTQSDREKITIPIQSKEFDIECT